MSGKHARQHAARRPKPAICQLTEVSVRAGDYGRSIGFGAEVDLHELVAPGLTLEDALGDYITGFAVVQAA